MVTVPLNVLLSKLTSKPDGGVTNMPPMLISKPEAVKLVLVDAVPNVALNAANVPDTVINGAGVTVLAVVATFTLTAPLLLNTTLPE